MRNFTDEMVLIDGVEDNATEVTATVATDVLNGTAHGYSNDEQVILSTTTTLPAGLSDSVYYWVVNATANTFQVSLTKGGTAVDITDTGTGTHTATLAIQKKFNCSDYEYITFSFNTSGTTTATLSVAGTMMDAYDDVDMLATRSESVRWDYVDITDLEDGASIDGDTTVALSGSDDNRHFKVSTEGFSEIGFLITGFTAGSVTLAAKGFAS